MSEELGFHQRLGNGAAIDRDEGAGSARALLMNRLRDKLLAGSTLARDQHRRQPIGGLSDDFEQLDHLPALPDEAFESALAPELRPELAVLVLEPLALERVGDRQLDLVELEGLGDVVVGAQLHGLDRRFGRRERGHHEDHGAGRVLLRGAQDGDAVDLPHAQVGDDEVERFALDDLHGLLAALGDRDLVTGLPQHDREELSHAPFVVDDKYPGVRHGVRAR